MRRKKSPWSCHSALFHFPAMIVQQFRPPSPAEMRHFAVTEDWWIVNMLNFTVSVSFQKSSPLLSSTLHPPSAALPDAVQGTCWRCFRPVWLGRAQLFSLQASGALYKQQSHNNSRTLLFSLAAFPCRVHIWGVELKNLCGWKSGNILILFQSHRSYIPPQFQLFKRKVVN